MIQIQRYLLYIAIIAIPFLLSLRFSSFGGLGKQASFYPLLVGIVLWGGATIFFQGRILIPRAQSFFLLILFVLVALISGGTNFISLMELQYQGATGIDRFILQFGALVFYVSSALYVCNMSAGLEEDPLYLFERFLLFSFIIPALYSGFELMRFLGSTSAMDIIRGIDSLFRPEGEWQVFRLRSVTAEPSCFGMYSAILFPWLCSLVFRSQGWKKIMVVLLFFYFIVINIFTFSRTSYVALGIELLLFLLLFRERLVQRWRVLLGIVIIGGGLLCWGIISVGQTLDVDIDIGRVYLSLLMDDQMYDASNIARYGSVSAAFSLWRDFPLLGCGFGGFGFYAADYYPAWAWVSLEIANWGSNSVYANWPPVHNIYARILCETGIIGLLLWLGAGLSLIREEWDLLRQKVDRERVNNLLISTVGVFICGFNADVFHLFAYWIIFGIVWSYKHNSSDHKTVAG